MKGEKRVKEKKDGKNEERKKNKGWKEDSTTKKSQRLKIKQD